jgi:alpha-beta hydrolase superfamily lysophospholipase
MPPIYRWDSVSRPRAAVHVLHGMAEHAGRYARLAGALNDARFIVWAHDHRGHGKNPRPPVGLGHFADSGGWRSVVDDAWEASAQLMASHPGLPLVLFAHSMGSFVGQTLMGERGASYRAVVLSGSNGPPGLQEVLLRPLARLQRSVLGARSPGTWLESLVFGRYNRRFAPNRTRFDWLTRDEKEVDRYDKDPLCGFPVTSQAWIDFLDGKAGLGDDAHVRKIPKALPVYLMSGSRDPVGEDGRGVERLLHHYERAGLSNVTLKLYDDARHELVNETNRDEVTRDLISWLHGVVPA